MQHPRLSDNAIQKMHERSKLEIEALELLGVIVAEFKSDPMSVQCFDLRIVERAKYVSDRLDSMDDMGYQRHEL